MRLARHFHRSSLKKSALRVWWSDFDRRQERIIYAIKWRARILRRRVLLAFIKNVDDVENIVVGHQGKKKEEFWGYQQLKQHLFNVGT